MEWVIQLPVLFFSVVVHEFCHGWAAYRSGDDTALKAGRLTLNPAAHIDAFGTVFLPLLCFFTHAPMFGWAKPVPVNPRRLRNPARDMVRVALMGPLANIVLAFAGALAYKLVSVVSLFSPGFQRTVLDALLAAVVINLFLAFFNLIPIHPLDGSRIVGGLLPRGLGRLYERLAPFGTFLILVLLMTRQLSVLVMWPMNVVLSIWTNIGLLG
ncbi:MAG: site-2 protease family protein [Elusimicrobiota bacterium]